MIHLRNKFNSNPDSVFIPMMLALLVTCGLSTAQVDDCVPGEPQFEFPTVDVESECNGTGQIVENLVDGVHDGTYRWETTGTLGSQCWQQLFIAPNYYTQLAPDLDIPDQGSNTIHAGSDCDFSFYDQHYLNNTDYLYNNENSSYPYGFRSKFNPLTMPGLGTFMPPAEVLSDSSVALVPPSMESKELVWNGAKRATLHKKIDLVTGMPIQQANELEIPFGGATFRLMRTRSGSREDMRTASIDSTNYSGLSDRVYANERWWDWAGQGWMISENPLLLVDSALPGPVGPQPVTTFLMLDAHHTIPFQRIESSGQYAAPPRFQARLEHNGEWFNGDWVTLPTQYDIYLYDGELKYSFVVLREDMPQNRWEDSDGVERVSSYHDRPILPGPGVYDQHSPYDHCENPGFGIPYLGLCFKIEDRYGHEVRINYSDVESQPLDMEDTANCVECSQSCGKKGMISSIELKSQGEVLHTLIYSYRGMFVNSNVGYRNQQMNEQYPEDPSELDYDPANPSIYNDLWGGYHIDRIHVIDGILSPNEFEEVSRGLTVDHRDPNALDIEEIAASPFVSNPALINLGDSWTYRVRNHYIPNANGGMWRAGLKVMTTLTERFVDAAQGALVELDNKARWVYHYETGTGGAFFPEGGAMPPSEASWTIRWLSRMYTPSDIDALLTFWMSDPESRPDKPTGTPVVISELEALENLVKLKSLAGPSTSDIHSFEFASGQWEKHTWFSWANGGTSVSPKPNTLISPVPGGNGAFVTRDILRLHSDNYKRTVRSARIRDESGQMRYYQINRLRMSPYSDTEFGNFGQPDSMDPISENSTYFADPHAFVSAYNYHQRSVFYAPFKWQHVKDYQSTTSYIGLDSPSLTEPRWIVIVDEFPNQSTSGVEYGEISGTENASTKPGQLSRRVIEMSASGHVLTDKLWEFTSEGVVRSGGGLGEQFIYMRAEDYFNNDGDTSTDFPAQIPNQTDEFRSIRDEPLLVEYRSVGYSVDSQTDSGLTRFIDYSLFNPDEQSLSAYNNDSEEAIPLINRIQPVAEGIRRGVTYAGLDSDSNSLPSSINPKLYKTQTFRDADNPLDVIGAVEYVVPTHESSAWFQASFPQIDFSTTPEDEFRVLHTVVERDDSDPDVPEYERDILSRMIVGAPKQVYPNSAFYYPVEREFYDPDTGFTTWSCSGLVRNPNQPGASSDPYESLIFTYFDRDNEGRSENTVLDALANTTVPSSDLYAGSNSSVDIPSWPQTQGTNPVTWQRIGQSNALEYVTTYKYHYRHGLVDAFFPSGRRWAKRVIGISAQEAGVDWDQGMSREFIFNDLERVNGQWVTNSEGEVNDSKRNTGRTQHPPTSRRRVRFESIDSDTNGDIKVSSVSRPVWVIKNAIRMALDADGRMQEARLLERSANGQMLAVGTKQVNDLGALYREQELDGTIMIQTRNALGQTLRVYKGTLSGDAFGIGAQGDPDNMQLVNRTQYGASANDAWLPTIVRRYDKYVSWQKSPSPYSAVSDDADTNSMATKISYDWQNRAVRADTYARGVLDPSNNVYPRRLSTTLTFMDYSDQPYLEVVYGADPEDDSINLSQCLSSFGIDPANYVDGEVFAGHGTNTPDVGLLDCGLTPISVSYTVFSLNGTAVERRSYDPASLASAAPQYQSSYSYNGVGGIQVYSQSPGSPIGFTSLDGVGRVASEITMSPNSDLVHSGSLGPDELKQLTKTEYSYDPDGNVTNTIYSSRTLDDGNDLLDAANAIRTRTRNWYNPQKRLIATAELGTENPNHGYKTPLTLVDEQYETVPTWNATLGQYDHVPGYALVSLSHYDDEGNLVRTVDPKGIATEYEYSETNRLLYKTENADAIDFADQLMTAYRYQYGRLTSMSQVTDDRRALVPPTTGDLPDAPTTPMSDFDRYGDIDLNHTTGVVYGAEIVRLGSNGNSYSPPVTYDNSLVGSLHMPDEATGQMSDEADVILRYTLTGQIAERFDASGGAFRYFYDELDRLIAIETGIWDPSEAEPGFGGSDVGDPTGPGSNTTIVANGAIPPMDEPTDKIGFIEYFYDDRSDMKEVIAWTARDGPGKMKISHSSMDYDTRGMLLAERQLHGDNGTDVNDPRVPSVNYQWSYEATGNVTGQETGHHRLTSIEYPVPNPNTNAREITIQYGTAGSTEDLLSRPSGMNSNIGTVNIADFTYIADGRRSSVALKNGRLINDHRFDNLARGGLEGHDVFGRMIEEHWKDTTGGFDSTLYKGSYGFDAVGNRLTANIQQVDIFTDSGISGLEVSRNNVRSTLSSYDDLNRLVSVQIGELGLGSGSPVIVNGSLQFEDSWNLDSLGNWVVDTDPNDGSLLSHGRESAGNLSHFDYAPGISTLDSVDMSRNISQDVTWRDSISVLTDTTTVNGQSSTVGGVNGVVPIYDGAGRLRFDGQYSYQYDTWGRLVQINHATPSLTIEGLDTYVHLDLVKQYVYDGVGRLIRTTSPIEGSAGELETVDFYYDGIRLIQEIINTPISSAIAAINSGDSGLQSLANQSTPAGRDNTTASMGLQGGQLDPQPLSRNIHREYIWGPGDGGVDEILLQTDEADDEYWCIQDSTGDLVALAVVDGQNPAQVVRQWTYSPYGEVLTSDHLGESIESHIGHKGLFLDRLDAPVTTGDESPRLVPMAHASYHNRNRTYQPGLGRFLQMDPNSSGLALMTASASHGSGVAALGIAFSMQGMLGDGMNLYQYLGSNPWTRSDPMGLSYDPWEDIDEIIAEYVGGLVGIFEVLTDAGRGAALAASFVISMSPIPGVSIIGDVGLYILGAQTGNETMVAIALGIVPGGFIAKRFMGPLRGMISRITDKAVQTLTMLARNHSATMKNLAGAGASRAGNAMGWVGVAIQRAARKARRFVTGKCGCFAAATLVMTANGAVPIVEIEEGQQVLAAPDDGLSGSYSSNAVGTKIIVGEANLVKLIVLHEDGSSEVINTTDEHPFHVADTAEWTRADGLVVGDQLSTITGAALLKGVVFTTERVPVYNLSIPGTPTYYVGEHGVWVHNCDLKLLDSAFAKADWNHILVGKHRWARIGVSNSIQAKAVIEEVIKFGSKNLDHAPRGGSGGSIYRFSHLIRGEYVTVKVRAIGDQIVNIANAWVD